MEVSPKDEWGEKRHFRGSAAGALSLGPAISPTVPPEWLMQDSGEEAQNAH